MKKSPRPWKYHAKITRIEMNSGDVKYRARLNSGVDAQEDRGDHESLDGAEAVLDAWWTAWWPVQVKSRKPA
jgi:hypothetical protein